MEAYIVNDYGDGLILDEYNGQYSLIATTQGKDGTSYKRWVFLAKSEDRQLVATKKKLPMSVRLGNRETAIRVLEQILTELQRRGPVDDDQIPF